MDANIEIREQSYLISREKKSLSLLISMEYLI